MSVDESTPQNAPPSTTLSRPNSAEDICFSHICQAMTHYTTKSQTNKSALFFWSRFSLFFFWLGTGLLALIAYDALDPVLALFGRNATTDPYFFIFERPQILPTLAIALAATISIVTRKRGYLKAWLRANSTLTKITLLKARAQTEIAAAPESSKDQIAINTIRTLENIVLQERAEWNSSTRSDLQDLFSISQIRE
jgi:hypothetical protein